jgi:16S rRNA (guanine966-N2)-methyltransferase
MRKNKQIRIISGELGGRLIDTPNTDATQPMGDRERMAIFNRLRSEIPGKVILDAFAGSGALGLEALSLGAAEVDFLENNPEAIRTIRSNLAKLGQKASVIRKAVKTYNIIFADPPYPNPQYDFCAKLTQLIEPGGYFVLSHPVVPLPPEFEGLELISDKKYAAAHIKIYRKSL